MKENCTENCLPKTIGVTFANWADMFLETGVISKKKNFGIVYSLLLDFSTMDDL